MSFEFIPVIEHSKKKIKSVTVRMDGEEEELLFRVEPLGSRALIDPEGFYTSLNHLLANYDRASHQRLYLAYSKLHYSTRYTTNSGDIIDVISEIVEEIFSVVTWEGVGAWSRSGLTRFVVPERLAADNQENAGKYHPSSSYSPAEYLELCGLATVLKMLVPFWGLANEVNKVYNYKDKTLKRFYLGEIILGHSSLLNSSAVTKILEQIIYKLGMENERNIVTVPMGLVTEGITVSKYPYVVFNHLMLHDIGSSETDIQDRGNGVANNLSAKITGAIARFIMDTKREMYNDKPGGGDRDLGDGGNTTNQEMYNISEEISSEHTEAFKWIINNIEECIDRSIELYNGTPTEIEEHKKYLTKDLRKLAYDKELRDKMRTAFTVEKHPLERVQRTICGSIMDDILFLDALPYGSGLGLKEMRLICAAITYKHGWHQLTQLLLSVEDTEPTCGLAYNHIKDVAITTDKLPIFMDMYEKDSTGHPGLVSVEAIIERIFEKNWVCYAPTDLGPNYSYGTEWTPTIAIKDEIVEMIVYLYKNTKEVL